MTKLSTEAQNKLLQLKQDYISSFPDKTKELELCWKTNDLSDLRMQCHKIAGSSASFEFPDISFAAQTLEALCKTRLKNNRTISVETDKTLLNAYKVLLETFDKHTKKKVI